MDPKSENLIYTIGHSTHTLSYFKQLLDAYQINCVVDVRQVASSSYNPQYNEANLKPYLQQNGILYLHMGTEFGARPRDPELLNAEGKVDFDKVRASKTFLDGIERLRKGVQKGYRITLMCSQSDPFDCHRFVLIAGYLVRHGFTVRHILKDKSCIDNARLEKQLIEKYEKKLPRKDLFNPHIGEEHRIEEAYRLRGRSIAYSPFRSFPPEKPPYSSKTL